MAKRTTEEWDENEAGCYISRFYKRASGYATVSWSDEHGKRHSTSAHRAAYQHYNGRPASGDVDHLCHDPAVCEGGFGCPHRSCVRREHLADVSEISNVLRSNGVAAQNKAKKACPRCGGKYSVLRNGKRICPPCQKIKRRIRDMKTIDQNVGG